MSASIRTVLADDHAPTRADLRLLLEEDPRFSVCAEAADAPGAVAAALRERPDLCLMDIVMPGNGIAATWEITARLPETKVVMLTVSREDRDLFPALRAGAAGYLPKDMDLGRLPDALADVVDGEAAMPRALLARVLDEFRDRDPRRRGVVAPSLDAPLTSREWQVLDLLRRGMQTAEIAERLNLSQATIRSHVAAVLRKLRVPDRGAAIRLFAEAAGDDRAP